MRTYNGTSVNSSAFTTTRSAPRSGSDGERCLHRLAQARRQPKIREKLIRQYPVKPPATSTVHAVLDRHGLVKRRKRRRCKARVSWVFAGETAGICEVSDQVWLVSFMDYDVGFFDNEENRVEAADNPFIPKVLPMSSVRNVTHVSGIHRL